MGNVKEPLLKKPDAYAPGFQYGILPPAPHKEPISLHYTQRTQGRAMIHKKGFQVKPGSLSFRLNTNI